MDSELVVEIKNVQTNHERTIVLLHEATNVILTLGKGVFGLTTVGAPQSTPENIVLTTLEPEDLRHALLVVEQLNK